MTSSDTHNTKPRASWIRILLFLAGLSLLSAVGARAQSVGGCVANFGGVIDGFVNPVPPSQINIDGNCTIRNFPASNPLTSNISFTGTGRGWLVIFDNVDFIGNMSCDKVHGNFIWFVNGSTTTLRPDCENLFVPVDKIDKENPPGRPSSRSACPLPTRSPSHNWSMRLPARWSIPTGRTPKSTRSRSLTTLMRLGCRSAT